MKIMILYICAFVYILINNDAVSAHSVRGEAASATGILVTAAYDDGEPMSYAATDIFCCGEKLPFQSGRTDKNGRFLFLPDKPGIWEVVIHDEMGHQFKLKTVADTGNQLLETGNNQLPLSSKHLKVIIGFALISGFFSFFFWMKKVR